MNVRALPHFVVTWNAAARRNEIVAAGLTYAAARAMRDEMRAAGNENVHCLSDRHMADYL